MTSEPLRHLYLTRRAAMKAERQVQAVIDAHHAAPDAEPVELPPGVPAWAHGVRVIKSTRWGGWVLDATEHKR